MNIKSEARPHYSVHRYVKIDSTGVWTTSRRKPKKETSSKEKWYRALTMIIRRAPDYFKKEWSKPLVGLPAHCSTRIWDRWRSAVARPLAHHPYCLHNYVIATSHCSVTNMSTLDLVNQKNAHKNSYSIM